MKRNITFMIILSAVLILMLLGSSLAKNIEIIKGTATANVASPVFIAESSQVINMTDNNKNVTYKFSVKNYDVNKQSDVDVKYRITIFPLELDPSITIKLYKDTELIPLNNHTTEWIEMKKDMKLHEYSLEVIYDKEASDLQTDLIEKINIGIEAIQDMGWDYEK